MLTTSNNRDSTRVPLGRWVLDTQRNALVAGNVSVSLEPRVAQTLLALLNNAGETVSREQLITEVWGHQHVTDDALNRCIALIRKAFTRLPAPRPSIETIPRLGYALHVASAPAGRRFGLSMILTAVGGLVALVLVVVGWVSQGDTPAAAVSPVTQARPVTSLPGLESGATVSADGTSIAFAHKPPNGTWRLMLQQAGAAARRLPTGDGNALAPRFGPEGDSLVFVSITGANCTVQHLEMASQQITELARCDRQVAQSLAWSGDGRTVYFVPPQSSARGISAFDLINGQVRQVTFPPANSIGDADPVISADGRSLAFTRWYDYGVGELHYVDLSSGEDQRLTSDGMKIHGSAWLGDTLLFASNRGGHFALWQADLSGGEIASVPLPGRDIDAPVIGPEGALIFEYSLDHSNIEKLDWSRRHSETVAASSRWDWGFQQSPDGRRFAVLSDRSGAPEVWVGTQGDASLQQMTDHGGAFVARLAWSTDGQKIAYEVATNGQFDLYELNLASGDSRRLTEHPASDRNARYASDGQHLLFSSKRLGEQAIWRLHLRTGELEKLALGGVAMSDYDGLYVADCQHGGLRRIQGPEHSQLLTDELLPVDCNNWHVDAGTLYFARRDLEADSVELVQIDGNSGTAKMVTAMPGFDYSGGLQVIENTVYYTRRQQMESDLFEVSLR